MICKNFINHSQALLNFGVNAFDDFGCKVSAIGNFYNEQYDCINPAETPCSENGNKNRMYEVCLGTVTE